MDGDTAAESNLHRQPIHAGHVGENKARSARKALARLNPHCRVVAVAEYLTPANAVDLVRDYDVVVDATDNPATRYLVNDTCVTASRPLVSCASIRLQGQLAVFPGSPGPCLRCVFPQVPVPEACADAGVLGPVPGLLGCWAAIEVLKLLVGSAPLPCLLLFDATAVPPVTTFGIRRRKQCCCATGEAPPPIPAGGCAVPLLGPELRVRRFKAGALLDVRPAAHFAFSHLEGAHSAPLATLPTDPGELRALAASVREDEDEQLVVVCRRGNDSAVAVRALVEAGVRNVRNLVGGLGGLEPIA